MKDQFKTKQVLIQELASLKQRIKELEQSESERKRNEEALCRAEENFRRSLDDSPLGILIVTVDGETIYANRAILNIYSYEDLKTIHLKKRYTPESYAEYKIRREKRKRGDYVPSEYEISIIRKDGEVRNLQVYRKEILWDGERQFQVTYQDITDRKRAEEELRESEEKYRYLVKYAPTGIYEVDLTARKFLSVNDAMCQYTGYTKDEFLSMDAIQFLTDESQKSLMQRHAKVLAREPVPDGIECQIKRKNGSEFWALLNSRYSYEPNNRILSTGIVHDITERKRADNELRKAYQQLRAADEQMRAQYNSLVKSEQSMRESEEKYRNILENMAEGYFEIDLEGNMTFCNDSTCSISGYSQSELVNMNYRQYTSPETAKILRAVYNNIYKTGEKGNLYNFELIRKDKQTRNIELSLNLMRNSAGEAIGFRCIARDITERKRAEDGLLLNAQRMQALLQLGQMTETTLKEVTDFALEQAVALTKSKIGYLAFLNTDESVLTMHSWSKTAMLECDIIEKPIHYPVGDTGLWGEAVRQRRHIITNDYSAPNPWKKGYPEGHVRVLRHMNVPIFDGSRIVIVAGVGNKDEEYIETDVQQLTLLMQGMWRMIDRKCAEEEKQRLQERLQRAEKMEALGALAGGVAHDLNNVLGVLVGYSELLMQNVPQDSPFQRHAMQIFKGGQRAAAIIQDLLTLARRGVLVSEPLNLNRVILDFMQMPEFEAIRSHHPGVQFKTSLDAELLNVKGSSTHLSKTVMNLLSNAAEAITGFGEVLIKTENRYVDTPIHGYDTTKEGEYAVLTVSDTGSGISSSDIGRIFEPFYTKKVMGRSGTGLGLAVVWGTVKDHSGYIDVESTEGKGTVFTLYFPVTREDLTKVEQVVPQSTYLGRGEHILVVDDVEGQRLLASAMLERLGYKVNSVAGGEEAIEFVKKQPVDLLILDMIMDPGIDGLDTYRSILDIRPQQKAIIVSGFSETDRVTIAQTLGAGAYVRKPYIIEKFGLAVKKELDRK